MSGQGFPVNEGEATKIEAIYKKMWQDFVEPMIKAWNEKLKGKENQIKPELEIWQDDKQIFGKDKDGKFINSLNPKILTQLEKAKNLPIGSKTELKDISIISATSLKRNQPEILFKTDKDGIITNNIRNQTMVASSDKIREFLSKADQNKPEIQFLSQQVTELKEQLQRQQEQLQKQQEQLNIQLKINAHQKNLNKRLLQNQQVREARANAPEHQWWQKGINKFAELKQIYQQRRQEQMVANTLNKLWNKKTTENSKIYQGEEYTIEKNDEWYTLKNKNNENIFEYSRYGKFDNNVMENRLSQKDLKEIEQLKDNLKKDRLTGKFASITDKVETRNIAMNKILKGFQNIAQKQPDGNLSRAGKEYKISAKANGEISIWRKQELIYKQSQQESQDKMQEKDILFLSNSLTRMSEARKQEQQKRQQQIKPEQIIKQLPLTRSR